jgi:hypothetical protein
MSTTKTVRITGTMTFQNEHTGGWITCNVRPFVVAANTPWIEIVDAAEERCADMIPAGAWMQVEETLIETVWEDV